MDDRTGLIIIAVVVASVTIVPFLVNLSVEAASNCESTKGNSHAWYLGCKDGWCDHNH